MSDQVEERLLEILDSPSLDPYGNPVPGKGEREKSEMPIAQIRQETADGDVIDNLSVVRIGEPIQADPLTMQAFAALGLRRGDHISVTFWKSSCELKSQEGKARSSQVATIPTWMEAHLFVART